MSRFLLTAPILMGVAFVAGCQATGNLGNGTPDANVTTTSAAPEPVGVERDETVCPLIRFTVDGRPAEAAGYDTKEAIIVLRQLLNERGLELINVDALNDQYARSELNLHSNFNEGPQTAQGTSSQIDEDARKQIRQALMMTLEDVDQAELGNCNWILTGQAAVDATRSDPQSGGRIAPVTTWLDIMEAFDRRSVGSAYQTGTVRGETDQQANRKALTYSLESVADTVIDQIETARRIYTIEVRGRTLGGRELFTIRSALQNEGYEIRSVINNQMDAQFEASQFEAETALNRALDQMQNDYPGIDYEMRGYLIVLNIPATS